MGTPSGGVSFSGATLSGGTNAVSGRSVATNRVTIT
jgi:hypothetical protein